VLVQDSVPQVDISMVFLVVTIIGRHNTAGTVVVFGVVPWDEGRLDPVPGLFQRMIGIIGAGVLDGGGQNPPDKRPEKRMAFSEGRGHTVVATRTGSSGQ